MFLQLVHKCYKDCAVPQCKSNTSETPYKLFITLPQNKELRKQWLTLARVLDPIPAGTRMYFCADHFDLSNDMINYMDYYKSGSSTRVSLIKGCMPSKFECQNGGSLPSHTPQDNSDNTQYCNVTLPKLKPMHSITNDFNNHDNDPLFVKEEMEVVKEEMLNDFSSNVADTDTVTVKIEKTNDESDGIEEFVETKEDNKQDCNVTLPKLKLMHSITNDFNNHDNDPLFVKEEMEVVKEEMLNDLSSNVADTDTVTVKIEKTNDESGGIEGFVETKEGIKSYTVIGNIKECTIKKSNAKKDTDMVLRSCDVCYEMVFSKDYTKHLLNEHDIKRYSCKRCNKVLKSAFHLKRHNRVHLNKKYKCEICYKGFSKTWFLAMHKYEHEEERYACNICDVPFVLLNRLRAHVKVAHEGNRRSKASKKDPVTGMKSVSGYNFTNQVSDSLTAMGEAEDEKEKATLNDSSNNEAFTVTVKNKITNDLPTEDEEDKFVKDDLIDKCFIKTEVGMNEDTDVDDRNGHVFSEKTVKIEVRNDLPTEDEEGKLVKDYLIVNIEKCDLKTEIEMNEDTDVDNTSCHENTARDYESDLKIHSRNTLYTCKTCQQTFSRASRLKEHTYVHKREKPYACNLCDKTYSIVFDLQVHMLVHGTQCRACTKCDKTYTRTYDLMVHMRVHTGQKRHACTSCDKTFALASSLKEHLDSHKEEKPFACDLCNETFGLEILLEKHERDHARKLDTINMTVTKSYRHYGRLKRSQNILVKDVQSITEHDFSKHGGDTVTVKEENL